MTRLLPPTAHPDFPFKEEIYRKRPDAYFAKVIPRYAGYSPGWTNAHGQTMGKYAGTAMVDFLMSTRKRSKSLRQRTAPSTIMALDDPPKPPPTVALYEPGAFYIPNTTLYSPAQRERFGGTYSTLTRQSFQKPVPRIPAPLQTAEDGKSLEYLTLPSSYMGYKPRALPFLCRHLEEKLALDQERQRQMMAYEQQQQQQHQAAAEQQQQAASGEDDYPGEMYDYLDRAQGDAAFVQAVQAGAEAYRQEKKAYGLDAALKLWYDHRAYLDMTFLSGNGMEAKQVSRPSMRAAATTVVAANRFTG